jgi:MFS superfamily sulfate permease-like transporter
MTAWLYHALIDPLTPVAHQHALIGGSLIAIVCGVIGCFIVLRRMAFLTDALSHSMLAGVVSAYLFLRIVLQTKRCPRPVAVARGDDRRPRDGRNRRFRVARVTH